MPLDVLAFFLFFFPKVTVHDPCAIEYNSWATSRYCMLCHLCSLQYLNMHILLSLVILFTYIAASMTTLIHTAL